MIKDVTVQDCVNLQKSFIKHCNRAEQHEFVTLAMIHVKLDKSVKKIQEEGKVSNQKEARAMFRVVLRAMGKDCSEYEEN